MRCDGKTSLVLGAGSGIGRAAAMAFAAHGARLAVADINKEGAERTAALLADAGCEASVHVCDTTRLAETDALIAEVLKQHGALDIVSSTVGWSDTTFFMDEDEAYWNRIIELNLMGSICLSRSALSHFAQQKSGSIVLTTSDAGRVGAMGQAVYSAAKGGIVALVKSLARETARYGVRVNAISPGLTDTPLLRAQSNQELLERMTSAIPLKRVGAPDEPAAAMVFLASDAARYITGQTLSVSGGLTMHS